MLHRHGTHPAAQERVRLQQRSGAAVTPRAAVWGSAQLGGERDQAADFAAAVLRLQTTKPGTLTTLACVNHTVLCFDDLCRLSPGYVVVAGQSS